MSEAAIEGLIAAQEALVGALDRDDAPAIERALGDFRAALAPVRALRGEKPPPELRDRFARALMLVDAARVRVNFLADRTRRQLDRLAAAGASTRTAIAYGRDGRIR